MSYNPPTSLALRSPIYCPECAGLYTLLVRGNTFQLRHPYILTCIKSGEIFLHGKSTDCVLSRPIGEGLALIQLPPVPRRCLVCQHTYTQYHIDTLRVTYHHSTDYTCKERLMLPVAQFTIFV